MTRTKKRDPLTTFTPDLVVGDPAAAYWLRQVTIRIRREVAWLWRDQSGAAREAGALPNRFVESLELVRFAEEKKRFFSEDATARYLTELLEQPPTHKEQPSKRGSFGWLIQELGLDDVACFVLGLGLLTASDSAAGEVVAICMNDARKTRPTLALAQRLWDVPSDVLRVAHQQHPIFEHNLVRSHMTVDGAPDWEEALWVPAPIGQILLHGAALATEQLVPVPTDEFDSLSPALLRTIRARLIPTEARGVKVIPLVGVKGSPYEDTAAHVSGSVGRRVASYKLNAASVQAEQLDVMLSLAWLRDTDVMFGGQVAPNDSAPPSASLISLVDAKPPVNVYVPVEDARLLKHLPGNLMLPKIAVPKMTYERRMSYWHESLGSKANKVDAAIKKCARRFRFEKQTISQIASGLRRARGRLTEDLLIVACENEVEIDVANLAQRVVPRFEMEDVVLPKKQRLLLDEIAASMQSLGEVHYEWGTADSWSESGMVVAFVGPSGAGKTMAAERLARKLSLPMYRVDMSQVADKWVGETEKHLKRLFDAMDTADCLLLFDDAEGVFGKRVERRSAQEAHVNNCVGYVLDRVQRFKGLAVLTTNRGNDIDTAFYRRMRYVVEFPLPDAPERKRIWKQVLRVNADTSKVNIDMLSKNFALTGGSIRSAALNAFLIAAADSTRRNGRKPRVTMEHVIVAVKRELDKTNTTVSPERYGRYATTVEALGSNR